MINSIDEIREWGECHTKQIGERDCGLACVNTILNFFYDLDEYRQGLKEIELKEDGVSMLDISKELSKYKCRTLGVKVPYGKMVDDLVFPLIAHYRENHFIVIWDATSESVCISDPSDPGIKIIDKNIFCEKWDGVCLLIE